jgi:hypothetical protein
VRAFLIALNLTGEPEEYERLTDRLVAFGTWWHHLDNVFIIRTDLAAQALLDKLREVVRAEDQLLVVEIGGQSWAADGFPDEGADWLRENL